MAVLTGQQISDLYVAENLTPVFVTLTGSHGMNMPNPQDHDYWGYHVEDEPRTVMLFKDATTSFLSISLSNIQPYIDGDFGSKHAMWTVDTWFGFTPIYTKDPEYTDTRALILSKVDEDFWHHYTRMAMIMFRRYKATDVDKWRIRGLRMLLTVKYYWDYSSVVCDWPTLDAEYNIDTPTKLKTLQDEFKQLLLLQFADKFLMGG